MKKTRNPKGTMEAVCNEYYKLLGDGMDSREIKKHLAEKYEIDYESVGRFVRYGNNENKPLYMRDKSLTETRQVDDNVTITSGKKLGDITDEENWNRAAKANEIRGLDEHQPRNIKVEFNDYLPVAFAWMADLHLDDARAKLWLAERHAKIIRDTEGLYLFFGGDGTNHYIKQLLKFPKFDDPTLSRNDQLRLFRLWLYWVYNKTLAACSGNHEFYEYAAAGRIFEREELEKHKIHYSKDLINAELLVGDHTYRAFFSHTSWGTSRINPLHEFLRVTRHHDPRPDIVGLAHRHDPLVAELTLDSGTAYYMKSGTYKPNAADFEGQHSIPESADAMPVCIMLPDKKKCLLFKDLEEGAEYLTYLREKYKNAQVQHPRKTRDPLKKGGKLAQSRS